MSTQAADFVRAHGGVLWVWASYPRLRCDGMVALMHASTEPPGEIGNFRLLAAEDVHIWFRGPGGREPEVVEIGLEGRRRPHIEAYWDGCKYAI